MWDHLRRLDGERVSADEMIPPDVKPSSLGGMIIYMIQLLQELEIPEDQEIDLLVRKELLDRLRSWVATLIQLKEIKES